VSLYAPQRGVNLSYDSDEAKYLTEYNASANVRSRFAGYIAPQWMRDDQLKQIALGLTRPVVAALDSPS
jgi:hypothetical protein